MAENYGDFRKIKGIKLFVFVAIILLIILAGFFVHKYFIANKSNSYLIKNEYYGFELKTPKNWIAEENTLYSKDNINQLLTECKNDNLDEGNVYKLGVLRFKDQKYFSDFETGQFTDSDPTGAVLEVVINCISNNSNNENYNYNFSNLKIAGETAIENYSNLLGFGKTKYVTFLHNNFQYKISEYVYISSQDKIKNEAGIRSAYNKVFNEIISSFKFTK